MNGFFSPTNSQLNSANDEDENGGHVDVKEGEDDDEEESLEEEDDYGEELTDEQENQRF